MAPSEPNIFTVSTINNSTRNRGSTPTRFVASLLGSRNRIWNSTALVTVIAIAITDWNYCTGTSRVVTPLAQALQDRGGSSAMQMTKRNAGFAVGRTGPPPARAEKGAPSPSPAGLGRRNVPVAVSGIQGRGLPRVSPLCAVRPARIGAGGLEGLVRYMLLLGTFRPGAMWITGQCLGL
jgi:hypothetical protein